MVPLRTHLLLSGICAQEKLQGHPVPGAAFPQILCGPGMQTQLGKPHCGERRRRAQPSMRLSLHKAMRFPGWREPMLCTGLRAGPEHTCCGGQLSESSSHRQCLWLRDTGFQDRAEQATFKYSHMEGELCRKTRPIPLPLWSCPPHAGSTCSVTKWPCPQKCSFPWTQCMEGPKLRSASCGI